LLNNNCDKDDRPILSSLKNVAWILTYQFYDDVKCANHDIQNENWNWNCNFCLLANIVLELSSTLKHLEYSNISYNFLTDICTNPNVTYLVCCVQRSQTRYQRMRKKVECLNVQKSSFMFFSDFQIKNFIHCETFLHALWVSNFILKLFSCYKQTYFLEVEFKNLFFFYFKEAKYNSRIILTMKNYLFFVSNLSFLEFNWNIKTVLL